MISFVRALQKQKFRRKARTDVLNDMELEVLKKAIVAILKVDLSEITENTTFIGDLCVDSLDIYQIVMYVEDELGIEINPENINKITNVGEAVEMIRNAQHH